MNEYLDKINQSTQFIEGVIREKTEIGIILGTGLGGLVQEIDIDETIFYKDIPYFPVSTVESHEGKLIFGKLGGKRIIAMQGRFHSYEGYSMKQITLPVRVMKKLGADTLLISNACGGMNPQYDLGDIMVIEDHINLMNGNPLIGINDDRLGRTPLWRLTWFHRPNH